MIKTINGTVGCYKFPEGTIKQEKTGSGAFSYIANNNRIQALTVVIPSDRVGLGATIYVSAKDYTTLWAKTTYKGLLRSDQGEEDIIFVPEIAILAVSELAA
jgi:orotate phosphoribosyltransferase-like protein